MNLFYRFIFYYCSNNMEIYKKLDNNMKCIINNILLQYYQ